MRDAISNKRNDVPIKGKPAPSFSSDAVIRTLPFNPFG